MRTEIHGTFSEPLHLTEAAVGHQCAIIPLMNLNHSEPLQIKVVRWFWKEGSAFLYCRPHIRYIISHWQLLCSLKCWSHITLYIYIFCTCCVGPNSKMTHRKTMLQGPEKTPFCPCLTCWTRNMRLSQIKVLSNSQTYLMCAHNANVACWRSSSNTKQELKGGRSSQQKLRSRSLSLSLIQSQTRTYTHSWQIITSSLINTESSVNSPEKHFFKFHSVKWCTKRLSGWACFF